MLSLLTVALSAATIAAPPDPTYRDLAGWKMDRNFVAKPGMTGTLAVVSGNLDGSERFAPGYASGNYTDLLEFRDRWRGIKRAGGTSKENFEELILQMVKDGRVTLVDPWTTVKVISFTVVDVDEPDGKAPLVLAHIEILDGDNKGRTLETVASLVVRLKPPKPPAATAATLYKSAQNLDKAGKTAGAVEHYRRVVASYPGSPEAAPSAARLKVLVK